MSKRNIRIFDTTLRDGEQSPGASMNLAEKMEVAQALVDLGVDIIEAGFPIASPGDFEAVREIANNIRGSVICGLARCNDEDIDRAPLLDRLVYQVLQLIFVRNIARNRNCLTSCSINCISHFLARLGFPARYNYSRTGLRHLFSD